MPGLVVDGRWVAPLEIADGFFTRFKGLLGKPSFDNALLIRGRVPVRSIHTLGMRFPIDVAFCTADLRVVSVLTAKPHQLPPACRLPEATQVLEAEAGAFARWGIVEPAEEVPGSQLAITTISAAESVANPEQCEQ